MPGVTPYTFDPKATMGAAIDADFNARVRGMLDEAYAEGKAGKFAQGKGVPTTLTDAEAAAGLTMNITNPLISERISKKF
jgi:acyl-CoA reductase-like NAD-dependent aldehyde dehydrogenase